MQRLLFQPFTMVCFAKIHLFFTVHDCKKFSQNTPIFGNFLGVATIQKHPQTESNFEDHEAISYFQLFFTTLYMDIFRESCAS